jgi:hypothetical protein
MPDRRLTRGRCAAWEVYVRLTTGVLPLLTGDRIDDATVNPALGRVATRILRYAPLWGEPGGMLVAAVHSAVRLYRAGDQRELAELLRVVADRLYVLSAGGGLPDRGDDRATR